MKNLNRVIVNNIIKDFYGIGNSIESNNGKNIIFSSQKTVIYFCLNSPLYVVLGTPMPKR